MDTPHWPQGMGLMKPPMEEFASSMTTAIAATTSSNSTARPAADRRPRPSKEQALNCPRCNSTNTKFCYYNNYSLTQPRFFCKTCRRYWTEGGSLRNVPVGGGSRKNKRITSAAATSAVAATVSAAKKLRSPDDLADPAPYISLSTNPKAPKYLEGQDLNLAFHHPAFGDYPSLESSSNRSGAFPGVGSLSAMEMLKSRMPFMAPMPTPPPPLPLEYAAGFGLQEFRPTSLNFPLDATGGGSVGGGGSKFLFPFQDLKPAAASSNNIVVDQFEQSKGQGGAGDPPGFWSGIINGGGSW